MILKILKRPYSLALISGGLFALSWPSHGFWPLLFLAFVPLFVLIERTPKINILDLFRVSFLAFIIWNIFAAWWMCQYHLIGGVTVLTINAMCMACVVGFYVLLRKQMVIKQGKYLGFMALWLSWEWMQFHWDLSWPWLILGNGLASFPKVIQWYEFTGVVGGSLWILVINVLISKVILLVLDKNYHRPLWISLLGLMVVIFAPILLSINLYNNPKKSNKELKVLLIQQNTQPGIEQTANNIKDVRAKTLNLIDKSIDSTVALVVVPESAVLEEICEDSISQNPTIDSLLLIQKRLPNTSFIIGATTYKLAKESGNIASKFNTAIVLMSNRKIGIYHKTKLVPGVEEYPFKELTIPIFKRLNGEKFDSKFAKDSTLSTFSINPYTQFGITICYESIYGEYVSKLPKHGADFLVVITNDGWWDNTDGYKQHLLFGNIRAIETRKSIVRAANTGISCVVDSRGNVVVKTDWGKAQTILAQISLNSEATFYIRYGDYILTIANLISLLLLLLTGIKYFFYDKKIRS